MNIILSAIKKLRQLFHIDYLLQVYYNVCYNISKNYVFYEIELSVKMFCQHSCHISALIRIQNNQTLERTKHSSAIKITEIRLEGPTPKLDSSSLAIEVTLQCTYVSLNCLSRF